MRSDEVYDRERYGVRALATFAALVVWGWLWRWR